MSEPIKPMTTRAAGGSIPGPKMDTEKYLRSADFSCYAIGKVPKGTPAKVTSIPKLSSRRK